MRRAFSWMVGMSCAWLVVVGVELSRNSHAVVASAETAKASGTAAAVQGGSPSAAAASGPEKVVYTFDNDAKMTEFTNVWRQRQGIVLRMTVLQAYWNEEQAALASINNKFTTDYKLDVAKNYVLDDKRRVLIEREAPPTDAQPPSRSPQPTPSATPSTP